jgi:DNA-binding protein Fis
MAETIRECLAQAATSRAAADNETLENARQLHLEAAARWEMFADHAKQMERSGEQPILFPMGIADPPITQRKLGSENIDRSLQLEPVNEPTPCEHSLITPDPPKHSTERDVHQPVASLPRRAGGSVVRLYETDGNLRTLNGIEADVIRLAIVLYKGRITDVARRLGIGRSTLYRKLREHGIGEVASVVATPSRGEDMTAPS